MMRWYLYLLNAHQARHIFDLGLGECLTPHGRPWLRWSELGPCNSMQMEEREMGTRTLLRDLNWIELNHSMYIRSMFCCLWNPLNSSSLQFAPIHWQNYYLPHAGSTKEKEGNRQNKRTQRNYPWFYPVFLMLGQAWSRRDSRCRCSTECWNQHEIIQEHNTYSFVIVCVIHVCVCVSWSQNRIGTKFCEAQWEMERKQFITHIACCRAWPIDPQLMEDLGHWWPSVSTALALSFFGHPLPKFPRQCFNGTPSLWKRR